MDECAEDALVDDSATNVPDDASCQGSGLPPDYFVILFQKGQADDPRGSLDSDTVIYIQRLLRREIAAKCSRIDLWLDSPGGSAHSAYKLALTLRGCCNHLRVIIPDYAKSAASLLALAADEIFMADGAELGPLDAQIEHPDREGVRVSAFDLARAMDHLSRTAIELVIQGGAEVLTYTRLTREVTLVAMLKFVADFMAPVLEQLDPVLSHRASKELDVTMDYAQRLLAMRDEGKPGQGQAPSDLPRKLVEDYPSHGFVISRQEACNLGLNALRMEDYEWADSVMALHDEYQKRHRSFISVHGKSHLLTALSPESMQPSGEDDTECGQEQEYGEKTST